MSRYFFCPAFVFSLSLSLSLFLFLSQACLFPLFPLVPTHLPRFSASATLLRIQRALQREKREREREKETTERERRETRARKPILFIPTEVSLPRSFFLRTRGIRDHHTESGIFHSLSLGRGENARECFPWETIIITKTRERKNHRRR